MKKAGCLICCVLAACGMCLAQTSTTSSPPDPTSQTPEGKMVQEMFGKKISEARASTSDADDIAVARQLLATAYDGSTSPKLKAALAMAALRLTVVIGTEDSTGLAHKALDAVQDVLGLDAADKMYYLKELAVRRLARARGEHKSADELQAMAKAAIDACMHHIETAMSDDDSAADLSAVMQQIRALIAAYKFKEYNSPLDDLDKQIKTARMKRIRLKEAMGKLESARRAKDEDGIKVASKAVAQVYLEVDGDLHSAARYYAGIDDARGRTVIEAADVLDHPSPLDTKKALDALEGLVRVVDSLNDVAKVNAAKTALRLADLYLAGNPPDASAAKVKLAMTQWQNVAGASDSDKFKKELEIAYGQIQGKLEVFSGGRVSLTYNFSNPSQLKDWELRGGTWDVGKGMLGCKTGYNKTGSIKCRLPFRQDKPFKITFSGFAKRDLTCKLFVVPWIESRLREPPLTFEIANYGLQFYSFQGDWYDDKTRLGSKPSHVELNSEGDGNVVWSVDGAEAHVFKLEKYNAKLFKGSFKLVLQTKDAEKTITLFDTVTIEGTILPAPDFIPDEYKNRKADKGSKKDDSGESDTDKKRSDAGM